MKKVLCFVLGLCLAMSVCFCASADTEVSGLTALVHVMDLVCSASQYSPNAPESIPGADGTMTASFTNAFFQIGYVTGSEAGITESMLKDTAAQAELLKKYFAVELPQLEIVASTDEIGGYIGFQPVTVTRLEDGAIRVVGEVYMAEMPMRSMTAADFNDITWLDRAVFTLRADSTAACGYLITGFGMGTDLSYENVLQNYFDEISVEYESHLGFSLLYPAFFADETLTEDENGVSAALPDGSVSFFAKRYANANKATLADYVAIVANGITGSTANINEEMQYATVTYSTEEGQTVFDLFIVTEEYIYQAELCCPTEELAQYAMYQSFMENSFVCTELSQG